MFGVEGNRLENKNKPRQSFVKISQSTKRYHKIFPFVIAGIFIVLLIGYYLYLNYYSNYNYIKKDTSKYLVYTKYTKSNADKLVTEVPEINIDSPDVDIINKKIESYAKEFLSKEGNVISYETQINGDILSILLKMLNKNTGYTPEVDFYSYNINLKTLSVLSSEEILSLFGVTESTVQSKIENQFRSFYNDEVAKGIVVSQECDYECFLGWRNVSNYMDSVHYYVENGKLIVYRPFIVYSVYGEETYFKEEDFQFYIAG